MECVAFTGDGLTKYIQPDANEYETQNSVEKHRFEIKNETEDQGQSIPKSIGVLTVLRCILVQIWKYLLQFVVTYCADKLICSKWGKFWLLRSIWTWRSKSIAQQNNMYLNQGLLHLWSKFVDPSLNGWFIIVRTSSWLTDTRTHTHAGNDNTRRPKLAAGKNCLNCVFILSIIDDGYVFLSSRTTFFRSSSYVWSWEIKPILFSISSKLTLILDRCGHSVWSYPSPTCFGTCSWSF